jgi:hypothetical protein
MAGYQSYYNDDRRAISLLLPPPYRCLVNQNLAPAFAASAAARHIASIKLLLDKSQNLCYLAGSS